MATQKKTHSTALLVVVVIVGFFVIIQVTEYLMVQREARQQVESSIMNSPVNLIVNEHSDEFSEIEKAISDLFGNDPSELLSLYSSYKDIHYKKFGSKVNQKIFATLVNKSRDVDIFKMLNNSNIKGHWEVYKKENSQQVDSIQTMLRNQIVTWANGDEIFKNPSQTEALLKNLDHFDSDLHSSVLNIINSKEQTARSKFSSIEKSYYTQGNMPIEITDLSGIERKIYNSEFKDNLDNVYFRPTKLSTIKKFRGKYRWATNSERVSNSYHYLTDYVYYKYPDDEFEARRMRSKHQDLLDKNERDDKIVNTFYLLGSASDPTGLEPTSDNYLEKFDFNTNEYPISVTPYKKGIFTYSGNFKNFDDQYANTQYVRRRMIVALTDNHSEKLYIKFDDQSKAEKFQKGNYSIRVNFVPTKVSKIQGNPKYQTKQAGTISSYGKTFTEIVYYFEIYCKITSIELQSDVLGTLVWIPDDALKSLN